MNVSVTEIRNSLRCQRLFLLGRRLSRPVRFPVGGSAFGALFHRIVERLARMAEQPPSGFSGLPAGAPARDISRALGTWLLGELAVELQGNAALHGSPAEVDDLAEALRNFANYLGGICVRPGRPPREILREVLRQAEVPVRAQIETDTGKQINLEGRIDALFEPQHGVAEVVEYKLTGEETGDLDRAQVSLYRLMARQTLDVDAAAVILRFTPSCTAIRIERDEADRILATQLLPHLAQLARLVDGEAVAPPPPWLGLCPPCPLRAECQESFPDVLPPRDTPPAGGAGLHVSPEGEVTSAQPKPPATAPDVDEAGRREAETISVHVRKILRERHIPAEIKPPHLVGPTLITLELVAGGRGSVVKMDGEAPNLVHWLETSHGIRSVYEKAGNRRLLRAVRTEPRTVDLSTLLAREAKFLSERPGRFVLGEQQDGRILRGDLADPGTPHLLVGGQAGSGKSVLLRALVRTLVHYHPPSAILVTLVDPKRVSFNTLAAAIASHLAQPIRHEIEDVLPLLAALSEEMEQRYELFGKNPNVESIQDYNSDPNTTQPLPRHVVIVDEFQDLVATKKTTESFLVAVQRLGAKARAAGIHLVLATQYPVVKTVPGGIKANLGGRIALKVATASNSLVILDEGGAEKLLGKGDLLANLGHGLMRAQAPLA